MTAILVHDSSRFGNVLITGSESGEFVIWKQRSILDPDAEDQDKERMDASEWTTESAA